VKDMHPWIRKRDFHEPRISIYWLCNQVPNCLDEFPRQVNQRGSWRNIGGLDRVAVTDRRHKEGGWCAVFYGWGGPAFSIEETKARTLKEAKRLALDWLRRPA
jgi:hypothetical protein